MESFTQSLQLSDNSENINGPKPASASNVTNERVHKFIFFVTLQPISVHTYSHTKRSGSHTTGSSCPA